MNCRHGRGVRLRIPWYRARDVDGDARPSRRCDCQPPTTGKHNAKLLRESARDCRGARHPLYRCSRHPPGPVGVPHCGRRYRGRYLQLAQLAPRYGQDDRHVVAVRERSLAVVPGAVDGVAHAPGRNGTTDWVGQERPQLLRSRPSRRTHDATVGSDALSQRGEQEDSEHYVSGHCKITGPGAVRSPASKSGVRFVDEFEMPLGTPRREAFQFAESLAGAGSPTLQSCSLAGRSMPSQDARSHDLPPWPARRCR